MEAWSVSRESDPPRFKLSAPHSEPARAIPGLKAPGEASRRALEARPGRCRTPRLRSKLERQAPDLRGPVQASSKALQACLYRPKIQDMTAKES